MDHESLRTASTYLNNLLLARGLLRNGEPVDFVKPSKESRAQIINLVHDLILREDRDREQRDHVADTLRALRAEDTRKTHEIERLTTKSEEAARATALAKTAERTAQTELKKVETAVKSLHEQATKLKTTLAQVRTQCANDVRKRDLELARLKTHLQGQQRGNKSVMTAPSMTVQKIRGDRKPRDEATMTAMHDLGDPEYTLKQETTEFLTQLGQSLSDENDNLINVIRHALGTMRELLGMPINVKRHPDSAMGSMGSDEDVTSGKPRKRSGHMIEVLPTSYEALAVDMETTLAHLKGILTNPNFVSMEEVEIREEEIARLREGWEHMEQRWREVLLMMESWWKRMDMGESINIDDLRRGIGLVSPPVRMRDRKQPPATEQSFVDSEASEIQLPGMNGTDDHSIVTQSSPGKASPKRKRDLLEPPEFFDLRPSSTSTKSGSVSYTRSITDPQPNGLELNVNNEESEELEIPRMTIDEKLDAAQAEAEEAAVACATVLHSTPRQTGFTTKLNGNADVPPVLDDTLGKMPSPQVKRTRIRGRPRKRKSTLSPDELEALIRAADE